MTIERMLTSRRISIHILDERRLDRAQSSFAIRRVPRAAMRTVIGGTVRPRSGDVVLAAVVRLGQHRRLERPDGRRAVLHIGDEILVAYADRYAPDQYESHVPDSLRRTQLVASGGIASAALSRNLDMRLATDLMPVGLVGDDRGRPLNVADFALEPVSPKSERPLTVAVIGTSMNSGKTTTIHFMVHGLSRAGVRAGVTKVTGTGSGGDYWVMVDAGAHRMLDFTDAGLASTYRQPISRIAQSFVELVDHLSDSGTDVNFVEVADGIYQRETARLIESGTFRSIVDVVLFASGDASGAAAGVAHLRGLGLHVAAVSGRITRSPLATREVQDSPWPARTRPRRARRSDHCVRGNRARPGRAEPAGAQSRHPLAHAGARLGDDRPVHQLRGRCRDPRRGTTGRPAERPAMTPDRAEENPFALPRLRVALVVLLGVGQAITLITFMLLLSSTADSIGAETLGLRAEAAWRTTLTQLGRPGRGGDRPRRPAGLGVLDLGENWVRARVAIADADVLPPAGHGPTPGSAPLPRRADPRFIGDLSMLRTWISRGLLGGTVALIVLVPAVTALVVLNYRVGLLLVAVLAAGAAVSLSKRPRHAPGHPDHAPTPLAAHQQPRRADQRAAGGAGLRTVQGRVHAAVPAERVAQPRAVPNR